MDNIYLQTKASQTSCKSIVELTFTNIQTNKKSRSNDNTAQLQAYQFQRSWLTNVIQVFFSSQIMAFFKKQCLKKGGFPGVLKAIVRDPIRQRYFWVKLHLEYDGKPGDKLSSTAKGLFLCDRQRERKKQNSERP